MRGYNRLFPQNHNAVGGVWVGEAAETQLLLLRCLSGTLVQPETPKLPPTSVPFQIYPLKFSCLIGVSSITHQKSLELQLPSVYNLPMALSFLS